MMERKIHEAVMYPYRLQNFSELPEQFGKIKDVRNIYELIKFRFDIDFDVKRDIKGIRFLSLYADPYVTDVVLIDRDGDAHCFPVFDGKIRDFVF